MIGEYREALGSLQAASAGLGRRTYCAEVGQGMGMDPALTSVAMTPSLAGPAA